MKTILPGIYRHYKGNSYRVIGTAKHSETLEEMVIYETMYANPLGKLWVRPLKMFAENVHVDGQILPRFSRVESDSVKPKQSANTPDMQNLIKLLSILQLTKEQPLSGYLTAGIKLHETATLAGHHYTATLMVWLLGRKIKQAGGKLNERKVILMIMIHDLSEIFGGDIAGPLNRKYPELREYKDKIGDCAIGVLTDYLDPQTKAEWHELWQEMKEANTDEAMVVKICDQMDHQFFLEHHNFKYKYNTNGKDYRPEFIHNHIFKLAEKIQDTNTKRVITDFFNEFEMNYLNKGFQPISLLMEE